MILYEVNTIWGRISQCIHNISSTVINFYNPTENDFGDSNWQHDYNCKLHTTKFFFSYLFFGGKGGGPNPPGSALEYVHYIIIQISGAHAPM